MAAFLEELPEFPKFSTRLQYGRTAISKPQLRQLQLSVTTPRQLPRHLRPIYALLNFTATYPGTIVPGSSTAVDLNSVVVHTVQYPGTVINRGSCTS
eukprot:SAG11_NODE_6670_length_1270_cov_1.642186_2_plen_97_part_00